MSKPDFNRLVSDLKRNPALVEEMSVSGSLEWARKHGYELTAEELAEVMESNRELSDDELEQAAGGDDGWGTGTGGTSGGGTTGGGG